MPSFASTRVQRGALGCAWTGVTVMEDRKDKKDPLAVSVDDAVDMSGLGRSTIYAALSAGDLPSLKVGRRRLIPVVGLKAWLARHAVS